MSCGRKWIPAFAGMTEENGEGGDDFVILCGCYE